MDNDHNYLLYYKPLFLENEKTFLSKGTISVIHGKDRIHGGAIGITFYFCFKTLKPDEKVGVGNDIKIIPIIKDGIVSDSVTICLTKYQYLPPTTNIDTLKKNLSKEYKVLYSPSNPRRAILFLDSF